MSDKLAKTNSKIGKAILNEAKRQYEKERQDQIVGRVKQVHQFIAIAEGIILKNQEGIAFFKRQLEAIELGHFKFARTAETNFSCEQIVFDDKELNRERAFS